MSNIKLKERLTENQLLVEKLNMRISSLSDRQQTLERELENFKARVEQELVTFKSQVGKDFAGVVQFLHKNKK
jgi:molecular chaperone GrpE (heat shock protein)